MDPAKAQVKMPLNRLISCENIVLEQEFEMVNVAGEWPGWATQS